MKKKIAFCPKCQALLKIKLVGIFPEELLYCETCKNYFQIFNYAGQHLRCPKCKKPVEQESAFNYSCKACEIGFSFSDLERLKRWF